MAGPVLRLGRHITYSNIGLMQLNQMFEQRKVEATFSSFRTHHPLRTPSGPQWTESDLESKLLIQLAFAPGVYDLMTQPIIRYLDEKGIKRTYTPDIVVQLHADIDDYPTRYIIEVKRQAAIDADDGMLARKFAIGRLGAEAAGAAFRVMTDREIDTGYLINARVLKRRRSEDFDTEHMDLVLDVVAKSPTNLAALIETLEPQGLTEPLIRDIVERFVAHRIVYCDLTQPFDEASAISTIVQENIGKHGHDPILRILRDASNGVNI